MRGFKKRLKRPCSRCGEIFLPTGKYERVCDRCKRLSRFVYLSNSRKHNCPYLGLKNTCSNKYLSPGNKSPSKLICPYSKPQKCILYINSRSKLKRPQKPLKHEKW